MSVEGEDEPSTTTKEKTHEEDNGENDPLFVHRRTPHGEDDGVKNVCVEEKTLTWRRWHMKENTTT